MSTVIKLPEFNNHAGDDKSAHASPKDTWHWLRRLTRILLMLIGSALTIYVCILSSERYFKYWVQTTIDRTDVHVSEINFPAITICPTHVHATGFRWNENEQRFYKLYNLVQSIRWRTPLSTPVNFSELEAFNNVTLMNVDSVINFGYTCKDLFTECTWRRRTVDCCGVLFRNLNIGNCFVFNSLHAEDADPTWPWSVADAGFKSALNIKVNRYLRGSKLEAIGATHIYQPESPLPTSFCHTQVLIYRANQFKVIVQEPSEYVGSSVTYSADDRIIVALQPLHFTAEPAVKARPVDMRYCYFTEELNQSYSECIVGCHLRYISRKCECTHHGLLPADLIRISDRSVRLCTVADIPCMQKNGVSLFYMGNIIEESTDYVFNTTDCQCYPICDHTEYHASTFTDRLNLGGRSNQIEIDVYFQEETLFSYRSTLHITILDLMVSFGGIAGLFLGLSVLGALNSLLDRIPFCSTPKR